MSVPPRTHEFHEWLRTREARARELTIDAFLASPQAAEELARALHYVTTEEPGLLSDADMLNDPRENDSRSVAASILDAWQKIRHPEDGS